MVFRRKLIHLCQRICFFPSAQVWAEQHGYLFLLKVYRTLCHFVTTISPCSSPTQHTSTNQSAHFRCLSHHKTCQWQVRRRIPSSALEPLQYARSAVEFHSHTTKHPRSNEQGESNSHLSSWNSSSNFSPIQLFMVISNSKVALDISWPEFLLHPADRVLVELVSGNSRCNGSLRVRAPRGPCK